MSDPKLAELIARLRNIRVPEPWSVGVHPVAEEAAAALTAASERIAELEAALRSIAQQDPDDWEPSAAEDIAAGFVRDARAAIADEILASGLVATSDHADELKAFADREVEAWRQRDYYMEGNVKLAEEIRELRKSLVAPSRQSWEAGRDAAIHWLEHWARHYKDFRQVCLLAAADKLRAITPPEDSQ